MKNVKKICICGHSILTHIPEYFIKRSYEISDYIQDACYKFNGGGMESLCMCMKFKQDNLKYLEHLYEIKNGKFKTV
jgi:hypothetical protein